MSMHPARQAYVEEEQEVRFPHLHPQSCSRRCNVHTLLPERVLSPPSSQRVGYVGTERLTDGSTIQEGVDISNIRKYIVIPSKYCFSANANTTTATDTNYAIPAAAPGQRSKQASSVLNEFRRKREAAAIAVPTDDKRVRLELRQHGEPITLFGERPEDRRDRLRELLYAEQEGGDEDESMADVTPAADEVGDEEEVGEFYTEGTAELLAARREIARYSLPRAAQRIAHQKVESQIPVATHVRHRMAIKQKLGSFELFGSQIASERPMSIVRFAPNGQSIACGDWAGSIKLLDVPNLETQKVFRGHKGMVGGIDWYPSATLPDSNVSPSALSLASGGGEGDVHLWNLEQDTPIATLNGHTARVCRTVFHPSGSYLASASYDTTWRLWSLETQQELLLQEGHSKEVYALSFSPDGSLLASAGLDSIGRIWDLRTGRTVMLLEGHVAPVYAAEWGVDNVRVCTGSGDGFAKVWDLRAVREVGNLGAHRGGVSDLRWFKGTDGPLSGKMPERAPEDVEMTNGDETNSEAKPHPNSNGEGEDEDSGGDNSTGEENSRANSSSGFLPKKSGTFLVSSGFDKAVNIFSADDWALCKSLTGHDGTVLSTDVTSDAGWIVSCGRDRTVKLWGMEDGTGGEGL